MTLFRNSTHQEMWRQHWCETCFQPDEAARRIQGKATQCPIWEKAMRTGRKPPEWDRMPRADEMVKTIRCNEHTPRPPINKRAPSNEITEPLFDVTPYKIDVGYVPVDGWPQRPGPDEVAHQ